MARRNLKQSVQVDLAGNLVERSKSYEKALQRMGKRGEKHLGGMARLSQVAGRGFDRLGGRYIGLISGAAAALAIKQVGNLSLQYTRLGVNADISGDKIEALKEKVFAVSQAPDIRVDPSKILTAIEEVVERTGDLKFAEDNIRNIGLALQATGAEGKSIGAMLAEFQKQGIKAPQDVLEVFDTFNLQGKEGAFTAKDIANLGPRVVAAYNAAGRAGKQAMREMGAALQVIRMGTGSSEQAATAFEAMMRVMGDKKKIDLLKSLSGITVFDPDELKKGKEQLKPINELMVEIVKSAGGKQTKLSELFDAEAMRAFNSIAAEFKRTGTITSLEKFMKVQGDGTTTLRDSARVAKEFNSSLTSLKTGWESFASSNLTGPVEDLAKLLNSADKETVSLALNTAKWGAGILAALVLGRKMFGLFRATSGLLKTGASSPGGASGLLNSVKPIPVFVVNNGIGKGGLSGGPRSRRPGRFGLLKSASNLKGIAAMGAGAIGTAGLAVGAAGAAGFGAGSLINKAIDGTSFADAIGKSVAQVLATFGNEQAKAALAANVRTDKQNATVKLQIESVAPVRVNELSATGIDLDIDAGQTMSGF